MGHQYQNIYISGRPQITLPYPPRDTPLTTRGQTLMQYLLAVQGRTESIWTYRVNLRISRIPLDQFRAVLLILIS